jgi:hypothetical protein
LCDDLLHLQCVRPPPLAAKRIEAEISGRSVVVVRVENTFTSFLR